MRAVEQGNLDEVEEKARQRRLKAGSTKGAGAGTGGGPKKRKREAVEEVKGEKIKIGLACWEVRSWVGGFWGFGGLRGGDCWGLQGVIRFASLLNTCL